MPLCELLTELVMYFCNVSGKPKLKLYKDADGQLKGDALCCYLKVRCTICDCAYIVMCCCIYLSLCCFSVLVQKESIPLALNIIDGSVLRDHTISVEKVCR